MNKGFIYLMMVVDERGDERYKIGVTKRDINKRLCELNTGNPNKISLLNLYESDNYKKIEKILHLKYFSCKTLAENEWRNLSNENVFSFIEECKKADETISFLKENNYFFK